MARILQLIGSTGFYGAEAVVATLVKELPAAGIETCVGHIRYAHPDALRLEDHVKDCEVFSLAHHRRFDAAILKHLLGEIKRRNITVIHSHGYKPDFYARFIARTAGISIVSTCHLWTKATRTLKAYARLDALVLRGFRRVVAVSEPIYEELKTAGVPEYKLIYIPNGISVKPFFAARPLYRGLFPRGTFLFGSACRQVNAKGLDLTLQAMAQVSGIFPHTGLIIAGDGPKLNEYRQLAQQLGIADKVIFLGHCTTMPEFYASLDTFLLASRDEGLPMALLEAMASSRMAIACNVGSVNKVIRDWENGLLIPPDQLDALVAAMLSVISNRSRLACFGSAARDHILTYYSSSEMVRRYADLYRSVQAA